MTFSILDKAIAYTFVIAGILGVLIIAGSFSGNEAPRLPACVTEDSDNCYWDADTMGNGEGLSFTVINGVVTYK